MPLGLSPHGPGCSCLLRASLRPALHAAFVPLGRMAPTNYLTATPVMVLAGYVLDLPASRSWALLLSVAAGLLAAQWVVSVLWLRTHPQGPLEWLWRWATWGHRPAWRHTSILA